MSTKTEDFARHLGQLSPALAALLDEHKTDNFGELLPHLFLADVVRHVIGLWHKMLKEEASCARSELISILNEVEIAFKSGNSELDDLIHVSFLENLPMLAEPGCEVRQFLSAKLLRELKKIEW